jgi:exopolysaccharide production protein ExoZ
MITNLQLIRIFAALAVVIYHTDFRILGNVHTDFQAVCLFFVLSGFLITHVTRKSSEYFLRKRLIRIVPLYWLTTIGLLIFSAFGFMNPLRTIPLILNNFNGFIQQTNVSFTSLLSFDKIIHLFTSLLFIPYLDQSNSYHPIVGVGWTLNLEIFFYIIFALSLLLSKKYAPIITIFLIGAIMFFVKFSQCKSVVCYMYSLNYIMLFVLGILVYYVINLIPKKIFQYRLALLYFSLFILATFIYLNLFSFHNNTIIIMLLIYVYPPLIVVLSISLHEAKYRFNHAPTLILGDASYAIYLTHTLFIEIFRSISTQYPLFTPSKSIFAVILILILSSISSIFIYKKIEAPLINFLKSIYIDNKLINSSL